MILGFTTGLILTGETVTTNDGSFVATPGSSTIYTVYAEDSNGCTW